MTLTEWKRARRVLASGRAYHAQNGITIYLYAGFYGTEYSVHAPDGNCITVEYDLENVKGILVG